MKANKRTGLSLGHILGIPIILDFSWFLIFGLLTFSLANGVYADSQSDNWPVAVSWLLGAFTAIILFGSVLLHELGHAVAARLFKLEVRRIRLMIFGGIAELTDQPPSAIGEFIIALAGPLVSIAIASASFAAHLIVGFTNPIFDSNSDILNVMGTFTSYFAIMNFSLAVFNLIPGFPLDGGRVFRSVVWAVTGNLTRATQIAVNIGRVIALGIIGIGGLLLFTGQPGNGILWIFIGLFVQRASSAELQTQKLRALLSQHRVDQVMRPLYSLAYGVSIPSSATTIAPDTGLWTAFKQMEQYGINRIAVMENGRLLGILLREDVFAVIQRPTVFAR